MDLIEKAYLEMYAAPLDRPHSLLYGRLRNFNARISIRSETIRFQLSRKWMSVSEEIQIGLIQLLLGKILKRPKKTMNIDLYHNFIKNLGSVTPTKSVEPLLRESFERVNEKYFYQLIDLPNLVFGKPATSTMGSYNFHTNTITISPILRNASQRALDYIMYHELLHKKLKFTSKSLRNHYHSRAFRQKEKQFENSQQIEKELDRLTRNLRIRQRLRSFFG
jgi:predicted SprT family Zn-dependent metalloprotease